MTMRAVEIYDVFNKIEVNNLIKETIKKYNRNLNVHKLTTSSRVSLYAELTALKREIELNHTIKG